jgi:hypothetical protein
MMWPHEDLAALPLSCNVRDGGRLHGGRHRARAERNLRPDGVLQPRGHVPLRVLRQRVVRRGGQIRLGLGLVRTRAGGEVGGRTEQCIPRTSGPRAPSSSHRAIPAFTSRRTHDPTATTNARARGFLLAGRRSMRRSRAASTPWSKATRRRRPRRRRRAAARSDRPTTMRTPTHPLGAKTVEQTVAEN